jgi:hypothetical protein
MRAPKGDPTFRLTLIALHRGCSAVLDMPRRKPTAEQLRQKSLIGFLQPHSSSTRNDRSRPKPGPASRATRVPSSKVTEITDQSDTDSGVEAIHFEPRKVVPSDDDDIQPSSPAKRRRMAAEVESHADHGTSTSSDSSDSMGTNQRASLSTKRNHPVSRSQSTEFESPPKRRRLAKGIRPSSPEEPDDLLGEVNEAGKSCLESREAPTNLFCRYHSVSLSQSPETDNLSAEPRQIEK